MKGTWVVVKKALPLALAAMVVAFPISAPAQTTAVSERMAEEPDVAFEKALSGLDAKTELMTSTWWKDGLDWAVDLEAGTIEFTNERGWVITAPVQVVGTYNTNDGTFMWGWDHPSVPAGSAAAAKLVRDFGERHGLEKLTTRLVELTEDEAWELTALADYLSEGTGVYRGPTGSILVYMTFGTITITQP